jgi:hypothetical protein
MWDKERKKNDRSIGRTIIPNVRWFSDDLSKSLYSKGKKIAILTIFFLREGIRTNFLDKFEDFSTVR